MKDKELLTPKERPDQNRQDRRGMAAIFALHPYIGWALDYFTSDPRYMSKTLVIQIPCFNEAQTLGETITDLPKSLPGFDQIYILVVDDGSRDKTARGALESGADYVLCHSQNRGLGRPFMSAGTAPLALGA